MYVYGVYMFLVCYGFDWCLLLEVLVFDGFVLGVCYGYGGVVVFEVVNGVNGLVMLCKLYGLIGCKVYYFVLFVGVFRDYFCVIF